MVNVKKPEERKSCQVQVRVKSATKERLRRLADEHFGGSESDAVEASVAAYAAARGVEG